MPVEFWEMNDDPFEQRNIMERRVVRPYAQLIMPRVDFERSTQRQVNALVADIGGYVDNMMARFITRDASIENDWAAFEAMLQRMGVQDLVSFHQQAIDERSQ